MAGWLLVVTREGAALDMQRWSRATAAATRYGGALSQQFVGRAAVATWRREGGEFPLGGRILTHGNSQVAWVGQCVDDDGDATARAAALVADFDADDAALARLNGPFAAAVVRSGPFDALVITDRHRHYPVYVARSAAGIVAASTDLRCIVPWLARPAIDRDALDMLLRCGELVDRQTLLQGVEVMPAGTVLSVGTASERERCYWALRSDGVGSLESSAYELAHALKAGVRRLEAATPRLGITLSGGLDSRLILDLCERPDRVPSFTWGLPGCRDIICATEFARVVGSPHVVKHWEPAQFPPLWSRGVDLTAGSCGIESMFMLPYVPLLASACDVVFNGLAGDVVLGGNWVKRGWLRHTDIGQLGREVWRWRVPQALDDLADRLTSRRAGASSAAERWSASIAARPGGRPMERLNDWLVDNRIFRTTNCGTMLLRGGVESHAPFFDRDFIDALARTRQEYKFKHRLYLEVMKRVAPRSASVTWQRTNVKPARGYYANLAAMAYQRIVTVAGGRLGFQPFQDLQVADPAGWMRGPWRAAAQAVVESPSLLQRGLVNPDVVKAIWEQHMAGADRTRTLSVLIAVELLARQTIDGTSP